MVTLEKALEVRDAMIQVARNRAGIDGATQSEMRQAQGEWLREVLSEQPALQALHAIANLGTCGGRGNFQKALDLAVRAIGQIEGN